MSPRRVAYWFMAALLYGQGALGVLAVVALMTKQPPAFTDGYGVSAFETARLSD